MRMSRHWTGLRTSVLALGLVAGIAGGAHAAVINYSTSGQIESNGVSGPGVISFIPITDSSPNPSNTINSPSNLSLGDFQVAALPAGQSTSYMNTPFHITFLVDRVNGTTPLPNETPIVVSGHLTGTVVGGSASSVVATFDPIANPVFKTGTYTNTLNISGSVLLAPSSDHGGLSSAESFISTKDSLGNPVPEPSTVALFLTTLAGLGLRRLRAGRRA